MKKGLQLKHIIFTEALFMTFPLTMKGLFIIYAKENGIKLIKII